MKHRVLRPDLDACYVTALIPALVLPKQNYLSEFHTHLSASRQEVDAFEMGLRCLTDVWMKGGLRIICNEFYFCLQQSIVCGLCTCGS